MVPPKMELPQDILHPPMVTHDMLQSLSKRKPNLQEFKQRFKENEIEQANPNE